MEVKSIDFTVLDVTNSNGSTIALTVLGHTFTLQHAEAHALARQIITVTQQAEDRRRREQEQESFRKAQEIPVDRSARVLTDGTPVTEDHKEIKPSGMQKGYVVLTPEERAKGFVRPVRRSYVHAGRYRGQPVRDLTETEVALWGDEFIKFEPDADNPATGRFLTVDDMKSGCGTVTTMSLPIAETYARDPKFYGGTFCCGCHTHLPLDQFVWEGTNEQVGS